MQEIWKPVLGYEHLYTISNKGQVKNIRTNRILKPVKDNTGYYVVSLCRNNQKKKCYIHRMVAESFIPKREFNEVNHIDENKLNNNLYNLEWCSHKDNIQHSIEKLKNNGKRKQRPVLCIELNMVFDSLISASKYFNGNSSNLCKILKMNNSHRTFGGYHWKYRE